MFKILALALFPVMALAQAAPPASHMPEASPVASLLPLVGIAVVFYFFMIRPQIKRHKELQALQSGLKKGDEVITGGGAVGKFLRDEAHGIAVIELSPGVEIKVVKSTIASVLSKVVAANAAAPKKKDARVKNDNVVPDKENVANDN